MSAQTAERHAEQIVRTRLCRVARQRLPRLLDAVLEMPLLACNHRQMVKRAGMTGLALQHLPVSAAGLGEGPAAVQPIGFLQQFGDGSGHGTILGRGHAAGYIAVTPRAHYLPPILTGPRP